MEQKPFSLREAIIVYEIPLFCPLLVSKLKDEF